MLDFLPKKLTGGGGRTWEELNAAFPHQSDDDYLREIDAVVEKVNADNIFELYVGIITLCDALGTMCKMLRETALEKSDLELTVKVAWARCSVDMMNDIYTASCKTLGVRPRPIPSFM